MTQVISVITGEYALLASDRRLTIGEGSQRGEVYDEDTCKLVNVCNTFGIGYTGLAKIKDLPMHEWIAKTLASENCRDASRASQILKGNATLIFSDPRLSKIPQEFLMAGWALFHELPGLHPFMRLVTNIRDESGGLLSRSGDSFVDLLKVLVSGEPFFYWVIGQPIRQDRRQRLEKRLERFVRREIGPRAALTLLVDEIVNTSARNPAVGAKVLAFSIPKSSVQRQIGTGSSTMLAKQADSDTVTFTYFEPKFDGLRQYGPTFVCGESAYTDIATENDSATGYQSSGFRILNMPKARQ
jgi:hypothetical protein